MVSQNDTILVAVREIIHDTVIKAFDSVIKLNDILMTGPKWITVVDIQENIHDTVII